MLIDLPLPYLVALDCIAWATVHVAVAWGFTQLPSDNFSPHAWWCRLRGWEHGGEAYSRWLAVHRWKDLLPDGAAWFGKGFPKARLRARDTGYLALFARETCRGELVHWVVLLAGPLFLLWNPGWMGGAMLLYAVLANLPCIVVQRYNRGRLLRLRAR